MIYQILYLYSMFWKKVVKYNLLPPKYAEIKFHTDGNFTLSAFLKMCWTGRVLYELEGSCWVYPRVLRGLKFVKMF